MSLSKFEKDMQIVQALDDEPNDVGGMTGEQLKAKFDEGGEALKQYVNGTLTPELDAFLARRDNPHSVTKGQVGLGSCEDTADRDKPVSAAQQAALDLKTDRAESAVRQTQIDAQQAALAAHAARADNPHGVTQAQVGLGNCDNTADADKPVSIAQQAALDLKTDRTAVLEKDNAVPYTPTADHHPATKRYVDEVTWNAVLGNVPDGSISTAKLAQGAVTREKMDAGTVAGFAPAAHAGIHAAGGADPVTPGSIGAATAGQLAAHEGRRDNPHGVTAAQVGASPVGHIHTAAEAGTFSREDTLKDATRTWLELPANAVPDDALRRIPKQVKRLFTEVFSTPGTVNWTCPDGVLSVQAEVVGGGGGGGYGYYSQSSGVRRGGGGGAGGYREVGTFPVTPGVIYSITIGAGGASGKNGGTSSFSTFISAAGGGSAIGLLGGTGSSGGGGGGNDNARMYGSPGGNGGAGTLYGGGGGGGGYKVTSQTMSPNYGGNGGTGGAFGGGGGGGGGTAAWSDDSNRSYPAGANGYGGAGGTYGGAGGAAAAITGNSGASGTNTINQGLEYEGAGSGGTGIRSLSGNGGGGGGGGYGGNGGNGSAASIAGGGGGGGGGYGGAGGNGDRGGGGGGGYGSAGGKGGLGGGGGGGYGSNSPGGGAGNNGLGHGAGGGGGDGSGSSETVLGGSASGGVCVLTYYKSNTIWNY